MIVVYLLAGHWHSINARKRRNGMYKTIVTLVAAGSLVYLTGCALQQSSSPNTGTQTITYEVFGMDCPGCHGGLEKNLRKIAGVVDAAANWKEQTVVIWVEAGQVVDPAEIEAAIERSNFTMGKRLD
jgi:copper chaperone CopZ